ncbi:MAG: pre-peptidase C-terminal domain-containing protein [Pirellulales bacterium]|nr:pre-peptidase C-terminal domain-containing protein [Pirellulales bacterium]
MNVTCRCAVGNLLPRRMFLVAALSWALLVVNATLVEGASPSLGSISPQGGQRGTELDVTFNGARLADAQEIYFYEPGISVVSLEAGNDKAVKVRLAIASDCRLGTHGMRVRTATGISELRTFSVGALPEIGEAEPNSEFETPQKVDLGVTVNGVVQNEDVDYFAVDVKQGQRITAEIEGIRLGNTFFDPYVAIMDKGRFELSNSDDAALVWQDGVASIVAPEDGTYYVQVRETAFGGNGACNYRLHIGGFPRPTATLPAGGRPGETLEVKFLGDVAGEFVQQVTLPSQTVRDFRLAAQNEAGVAPSSNVFRISDLPNAIEAEPNNGLAEATVFTPPAALGGVLAEPGDVDYFRFAATKGQVYDLRVFARSLRSPLDSVLSVLRGTDGAGLAGNDDNGTPDSYLRFTVPEDGEYVLQMRDHLNKGGVDYAYRIEVAPVTPSLVMGLPEQSQFVDIVAPVPKGNRAALLVSGSRTDFGGELSIELKDLPPGVTYETMPMAANQSIVPVLLTAAADAPLGGSLVDVIGRNADANVPVEGRLLQTTSMVRGQNNIHVWDHFSERMATAVTDESPYAIEIVQPQVPLVRDGTMNLKIVATRQEGFTAPIAVRMLYNPPGVGSSGSVSIPEGQNEVLLPLNANSGAEIRTWKIVVIADATVDNGTVSVASQLADLEIAEPFFTFAYGQAAVEKGQETDVVVTVTKNRDFAGPATVELLGLPNEVTTAQGEITQDSTELVFKVKTTANSPAGKHQTLLCRAIVTAHGEPITHMIGTGLLRIDEPLPPKADAPAPVAAAPIPAAEAPPEKRLTRLEQLRLDRQKEKEARATAAAAPAEDAPAEQPAPEPAAAGGGQ